jgi:hypothetical protein
MLVERPIRIAKAPDSSLIFPAANNALIALGFARYGV